MKFFLLSGIISMIVLGFKQQPDCSNFKTGKFKLVDVSINDSFIIDRTDSLQIETDLKSTALEESFDVDYYETFFREYDALEKIIV